MTASSAAPVLTAHIDRSHFDQQYQSHLKHLKLKGLQPKTIDAYARAIRRIGLRFDYQIDSLTETQLTDYFSELIASHSWSASSPPPACSATGCCSSLSTASGCAWAKDCACNWPTSTPPTHGCISATPKATRIASFRYRDAKTGKSEHRTVPGAQFLCTCCGAVMKIVRMRIAVSFAGCLPIPLAVQVGQLIM